MKRVLIALAILMTLVSCGNSTTTNSNKENDSNTATTSTKSIETSTVEVLYMHGKQRCVTCIAIGTEAETVVNELKNDKIVLRTINFSTPEGEKVADKYEIASSSLIVVKDDMVENLTPMSFQYARNNPELFKANLKEAIQKMLE